MCKGVGSDLSICRWHGLSFLHEDVKDVAGADYRVPDRNSHIELLQGLSTGRAI